MKYVVADNATGSPVQLRYVGSNACEQLLVAMKSMTMMYDVVVQRLVEAVELPGEENKKSVYVVTCDLPYNTRRNAELANLEHDGASL